MTDLVKGPATGPLLRIRDLHVDIPTAAGTVHALRGVDLDVAAGEVVGLVGESGGGKSMLARSVSGLLPTTAVTTGQVLFRGRDVLSMDAAALAAHRGHGAAMCFQHPRSALEPLRTVRRQLRDRLARHQQLTGRDADERAAELLDAVGIVDVPRVLAGYPHQLSGGMAQRVMVALCLACDPGLLLADEPTTGLDVTLTRGILDLVRGTAADGDRGVLLITHDIAAAARVCDRIVVLRAGEVVETGSTAEVLDHPRDGYTWELLAAVPDPDRPLPPRVRPTPGEAVVRLRGVGVRYRGHLGVPAHDALQGLDLDVRRGETVGIVGESGSGKTTLARVLLGLVPATAGEVTVAGADLRAGRLGRRPSSRVTTRRVAGRVQMVFQDPAGALDPRRTVLDAVAETLLARGVPADERRARAVEVLERTGLDAAFLDRLPHELSGGQAQRVGIARALVARPDLIVFDEPTSALDVTAQRTVLDLMAELAADGDRAQVFISHDLATVRSVCDRVVVVRHGLLVEEGPVEQLFTAPRQEYTRDLLAAAPRLQAARPG